MHVRIPARQRQRSKRGIERREAVCDACLLQVKRQACLRASTWSLPVRPCQCEPACVSARPGRARHACASLRLPASVQPERASGYLREPQAASGYITSLPAAPPAWRTSLLRLSLPIALPFTGMTYVLCSALSWAASASAVYQAVISKSWRPGVACLPVWQPECVQVFLQFKLATGNLNHSGWQPRPLAALRVSVPVPKCPGARDSCAKISPRDHPPRGPKLLEV